MSVRKNTDPETGIKITECDTWDDFIVEMRITVGRFGGTHIYRGHGNADWKLSSVFERWLGGVKQANPDRSLRDLFAEGFLKTFRTGYLKPFMHYARRLPDVELPPKEDIDAWLALARHHELISPILDWSRSPYISAYFACIDAFKTAADENRLILAEKKGVDFAKKYSTRFEDPALGVGSQMIPPHKPLVIWALACYNEIFVENEFRLLDTPEFRNVRLHAQQGLFTYLMHDVYVDVESYLMSRQHGVRLEKFIIPGYEAGKALHDLNLMGINNAVLFPDLTGAALQANMSGTKFYSN